MNKHFTQLGFPLKLMLAVVVIVTALSLTKSNESIETSFNIAFDGRVVTKGKTSSEALPFVDVYIEEQKPAAGYLAELKAKSLGPDAQTGIDGDFQVVIPVTLADDEKIAKAKADGSEVTQKVSFWLAYVFNQIDNKGNIVKTIFDKQFVTKDVIIVPRAKTQKSYTIEEKVLFTQ